MPQSISVAGKILSDSSTHALSPLISHPPLKSESIILGKCVFKHFSSINNVSAAPQIPVLLSLAFVTISLALSGSEVSSTYK